MREVYLHAAVQADAGDAQLPTMAQIPLLRRMTPLQVAVMGTIVKLATERPALVQEWSATAAPLYFASAYGELGAMLRVVQGIVAQDLPVSPKDFQHSVLNAAMAYVSMHLSSHQPAFAISGGYASPDLALHLAAKRIAAGCDDGAWVFHGLETSALKGGEARAELLLLAAKPCGHDGWRLIEARAWRRGDDALAYTESDAEVYTETATDLRSPWLLQGDRPMLKRRVRTQHGADLITHWQEGPYGASTD